MIHRYLSIIHVSFLNAILLNCLGFSLPKFPSLHSFPLLYTSNNTIHKWPTSTDTSQAHTHSALPHYIPYIRVRLHSYRNIHTSFFVIWQFIVEFFKAHFFRSGKLSCTIGHITSGNNVWSSCFYE